MTHIDDETETLGFANKFLAQICQTAAGMVRASQRILFVPTKAGDSESASVKLLETGGIETKTGRTFNGQDCRHLAGGSIGFYLIGRSSKADQITVCFHLCSDGLNFSPEDFLSAAHTPIAHHRGGKAGETLGVGGQNAGTLQVIM